MDFQAIVSGNLEKYRKFLKEASMSDSDNPMEATALENGCIPEGNTLAAVYLERRIMSSLPHIAYMVSRPRQSIDTGESLVRHQDWQCDFGGFTKIYEYMEDTVVKKMHSVAYVISRRTKETSACLCFTSMSGIPTKT